MRSPHLQPAHFLREPDVEVIRGRKARFTVLRQVEPSAPRVDAVRLVRGLLTVVMISTAAGAGGALVIHSDGCRHSLPRPLASAVGQTRTALLHILHPGG